MLYSYSSPVQTFNQQGNKQIPPKKTKISEIKLKMAKKTVKDLEGNEGNEVKIDTVEKKYDLLEKKFDAL